jgi:hypothetical protein
MWDSVSRGFGLNRAVVCILLGVGVLHSIALLRGRYVVSFQIAIGEVFAGIAVLWSCLITGPDSIAAPPLPYRTRLIVWVVCACILGGAALVCSFAIKKPERAIAGKYFIGTVMACSLGLWLLHYWPLR